jgi:hypothetical protein
MYVDVAKALDLAFKEGAKALVDEMHANRRARFWNIIL